MAEAGTLQWGFNPGQAYVKNSVIGPDHQRHDLAPFPAVIAPMAESDSLGMVSSQTLRATVGGHEYIGGTQAARLPLAQRQQAEGRLGAESVMYSALVQMSWQAARLPVGMPVAIATALPVTWRQQEGAGAQMEAHIRNGLHGLADVQDVWVQSEPGAVIYHELLTDQGGFRPDQRDLASGLVAVGDIGGSTLNYSLVENLEALPGQSKSPYLGSRRPIEALAQERGVQLPDAERMLRDALTHPEDDSGAVRHLRFYRESVIAELQSAWTGFHPVAYLFAGGTVHWFTVPQKGGGTANLLQMTFGPRVRLLENSQQAIAIGLCRFVVRRMSTQGQAGQSGQARTRRKQAS